MKRKFLFAILLACSLNLTQLATVTTAQDITITIKKDKQKKQDETKNKTKNKNSKQAFTGTRPSVDVAILLDTSNSMDGLINQAKTQLWNIVQQFADAKKNGQTPLLRVAVFEYGNTNLPANEGYIRQVVQLTDDLDKVSEALFGLSTNGGDEYCGQVISEAVKRLDWNGEPNAYKAIFIAGNEPFTQGSTEYQSACKSAIGAGIIVNTIHCGNYQQGVSGKWKHGAELAEGEYLNIDQDRAVVHIKCPQDKILIELNTELNKTYLWYGAKQDRSSFKSNQAMQDSNAFELGGIGGRAAAKASSVYSNNGRDLVDTLASDAEALNKIDESELPEELQAMDEAARAKHVSEMAAKRAEIKKKIAEVNKQRLAHIAAEQAKLPATPGEATLGEAVSGAVQSQLKASGFEVGK